LLESADGVNLEIGFPPSAEWEKLPRPDENHRSQIRRQVEEVREKRSGGLREGLKKGAQNIKAYGKEIKAQPN
jgi:hypothetical protein